MDEAFRQNNVGLSVSPLRGGLGAIVEGLDMSKGIDADAQKYLYDLWLDKGIIHFKNCLVTPEQHTELSQCFGELEIHPLENLHVEGCKELIQLPPVGSKPPQIRYYDGVPRTNRIHWHSDMAYTTYPTRGAMLRVIDIPDETGETAWVDTALAYEGLSDSMKVKIADLEAIFCFRVEGNDVIYGKHWKTFSTEGENSVEYKEFPDVAHKIVSVHPQSGRKSLNLSPLNLKCVLGMDSAESDELLHELVNHCLEDEYSYQHDWQPNDLVLWDNLRTWHCAFGIYPGVKRLAQRTTLKNIGADGRVLAEAS